MLPNKLHILGNSMSLMTSTVSDKSVFATQKVVSQVDIRLDTFFNADSFGLICSGF